MYYIYLYIHSYLLIYLFVWKIETPGELPVSWGTSPPEDAILIESSP